MNNKKILNSEMQGNDIVIRVELPEGFTQKNLIDMLKNEIKDIEQHIYGKRVLVTGRITTGMAMFMGHAFAHIAKAVCIFDPKENEYIEIIKH